MVVLLITGLCVPHNVLASDRTKIRYKGVTSDYYSRENHIFVNGTKTNVSKTPVFKKSGAYMGPLSRIFVNSTIGASYKKFGKRVTITYKNKKLTLTDGSTSVWLNGKRQSHVLGAEPMKNAVYEDTKTTRWIVPLKSVCRLLNIDYTTEDGTLYIGNEEEGRKAAIRAAKAAKAAAAKAAAAKAQINSLTGTTTVPLAKGEKIVLVLDAGHGGLDAGASGKRFKEKNMTLGIVLAAKRYFDKDNRFKVLYTRTTDTYPSLDDRWKLANSNNAELFISVHINSALKTSTGTETLVNGPRIRLTAKNGINSKELAVAMQRGALGTTGFVNRGLVNRTGLRILNCAMMPACIIEYGFISNPTEEKIMHAHISMYGRDLYSSIVNFMKQQGRLK